LAEDSEWTPRKRVFAALDHKEPDRVPINFAGCLQTTVLESDPNGKACTNLYRYLGIRDYEPPVLGAVGNIVLNMDERVMERFGSDFRVVLPNGGEVRNEADGSKTILGLSCGMRSKRIGYYDDIFDFPLKDCTSIKEIEEYPYWPTEEDYKNLANGKIEEVKRLRYVDIVSTFDDLGTQNGPIVSHDDYVKFMKPYEKEMIKHIKKYTNAKIYRHCCGSVYEFIPDLIEIGVNILNPVQPLAKNMEPWRLKKEFGNDIVFFGGMDIQQLIYKSTKEIRHGVKELLRVYAPGGGYIAGTSHNIEPDTPPENIVAMYEAVLEYGQYPIQ